LLPLAGQGQGGYGRACQVQPLLEYEKTDVVIWFGIIFMHYFGLHIKVVLRRETQYRKGSTTNTVVKNAGRQSLEEEKVVCCLVFVLFC
jgi:hypothetical protein